MKSMRVTLSLGFAAVALAGEPQCSPNMPSCYFGVNPFFGDAVVQLSTGEAKEGATDKAVGIESMQRRLKEQICLADNWKKKESCHTNCPLQLRITEPPHLRMVMCVNDNVFSPYQPNGHLDLFHPLNGKVMDLIAVGEDNDPHQTRTGCERTDFDDRSFAGKIAIIRRGKCYFETKFENAAAAGASAGVMVNHKTLNSIVEQMYGMSGSQQNFKDMPAVFAPRHYGDILFENLDNGVPMRGALQLTCGAHANVTAEEDFTDGCPDGRLLGAGRSYPCGATEDKLCLKCPMEAHVPKAAQPVCLYGNYLLPRARRTYLQFSQTLPVTGRELLFLDNMTAGGCAEADFAEASGKMVAFVMPSQCLPYESIRRAEAKGATGVVMLTPTTELYPVLVEGVSTVVSIPVHSVAPQELSVFVAAFEASSAKAAVMQGARRIGWSLGGVRFADGSVGNYTAPPTPAPSGVALPKQPSRTAAIDGGLAWNAKVFVCVVMIAVVGSLIVFTLAHARLRGQVSAHGEERKARPFSVSLKAASTGLCISLLCAVAAAAFAMAYVAGKDSTDTAVRNGNAVTKQMYENSRANVQDLSKKLRVAILDRVKSELTDLLVEGERSADSVAGMYIGLAGTWNSFAPTYPFMVQLDRSSQWILSVLTPQGFYATRKIMTDDRPDDVRGDGHAHVSVTDNGDLYGYQFYNYETSEQQNVRWANYPRHEWTVSTMLGGVTVPLEEAPVTIMRTRPKGFKHWYVTGETSRQLQDIFQPISVFTPVYNRANEYVGVAEARIALEQLGKILTEVLAGGSVTNMTVAAYNTATQEVLATNAFLSTRYGDQYNDVESDAFKGFFTLMTVPVVELNAFSQVPRSGEFNQRAVYPFASVNNYVMRIGAVGAGVGDLSGNEYAAEVRCAEGSGSGCGIVHDAILEKDVVQLDGASTLFVYQNLTTDLSRVAATRIATSNGAWASTDPRFSQDMAMPSGQRCVSYTYVRGAETTCMRREAFQLTPFSMFLRIRPSESLPGGDLQADTPRLFSTTIVGDSRTRLFGNGQLYVGVLLHGCQTKPFDAAMPATEWTSIALTVDWLKLVCAVYRNGELWDEAPLSSDFAYIENLEQEPLSVGQRFDGRVEQHAVFNKTLLPAEVSGLHATGDFARDVPDRDWLVDVSRLERRSADAAAGGGLDWSVAALVPRADILGQVDLNNAIAVANLQTEESNTKKELDQLTVESVLILVVLVLASVLVFLVFNDKITSPFALLASLMIEASVMRIDEIPTTRSGVSEVREMYDAMSVLLQNLREYKSYMPQSLVGNIDDEDDATSGSEYVPSPRGKVGRVTAGHSSVQTGSSQRTSRSGLGTSHSSSSAAEVALDKRRMITTLSLAKRKATFIAMNVKGWHTKFDPAAFSGSTAQLDAAMLQAHGTYVTSVLRIVASCKGVAEIFNGDRFLASFNTARHLGTHVSSACHAALQVRKRLPEADLSASMAVATGEVRAGNIGNETMKKYSFLSGIIPWVHALERFGRSLGYDIVLDKWAFEEVRGDYVYRVVDSVRFPKRHATRPIQIAELVEFKAARNEEWMYQLEDSTADPYSIWNNWAQSVFAGEWEVRDTRMRPHVQTSPCTRVIPHTHAHTQEAAKGHDKAVVCPGLTTTVAREKDSAYVKLSGATSGQRYTPSEILFH